MNKYIKLKLNWDYIVVGDGWSIPAIFLEQTVKQIKVIWEVVLWEVEQDFKGGTKNIIE